MLGFLIIFLLVLPLLAGALLSRGICGKRIDDHLLCRKCRFDLTGAPRDSMKCPECGANLRRRSSTIIGNRQRSPVMISVGSVLLLLSLTGFGLNASGVLRSVKWTAIQPDWWLVKVAKSNDVNRADAALTELVRRDEKGGLSKSNRRDVIDHIFEKLIPNLQSSTVKWSPLIERAWIDGTLERQRSLEYAQATVALSVFIMEPKSIHKGDILEFGMSMIPPYGHRSRDMTVRIQPVNARLGDRAYQLKPKTILYTFVADLNTSFSRLRWYIPVEVDPGPTSLHLAWQVECAIEGHPHTALTWQDSLDNSVDVMPQVQESIEFVSDARTAVQIQEALHFDVVGLRKASKRDGGAAIVGTVQADRLELRATVNYDLINYTGTVEGTDLPQKLQWGYKGVFHILVPDGEETGSLEFVLYAARHNEWNAEDAKPVWFGTPMTVRVPVRWLDGPDSDGVSEDIRRAIEKGSFWWLRNGD